MVHCCQADILENISFRDWGTVAMKYAKNKNKLNIHSELFHRLGIGSSGRAGLVVLCIDTVKGFTGV